MKLFFNKIPTQNSTLVVCLARGATLEPFYMYYKPSPSMKLPTDDLSFVFMENVVLSIYFPEKQRQLLFGK
jgi:hypothetical protein